MDKDVLVCRCEEVSRGEIEDAIAGGLCTLTEVRKATRAGMGSCQGRTCRRLVNQLLAEKGLGAAEELPVPRPPIQGATLSELSDIP